MMNIKNKWLFISLTVIKLCIVSVIIVLFFRGSQIGYELGYRVFNEEPVSVDGDKTDITINADLGYSKISDLLENKNIIRDAQIFEIQCVLYEYTNKFKSGTYTVSGSMKNREIMSVLSGEIDDSDEEEN